MKKFNLALVLIFVAQVLFSQNFEGKWNGVLKVQGMQLRLVFNISKNETGYATTMDSPDQGANGIPVTTTTVNNSTVTLEIPAGKLKYSGDFKNDIIEGVFSQNGQDFPMNLIKSNAESVELRRPQEPKKPLQYYSEEIVFENKNQNAILSGTLTLPKKEGNFPVVILISGSGPQNRDEEMLGHKPFLVISDYLTKNGIAVLRYDDRGTAKSTGSYSNSNSANFASDVESAIAYLKTRKEVNATKIGLVGHSEGGFIAPMVAARNKDVNFIILLAGPAMRGDKLLLLQKEKIERVMGISETDVDKGQKIFSEMYKMLGAKAGTENVKNFLKKELGDQMKAAEIEGIIKQLESPWMQFYLNYDPSKALEKTNCAVLALNGETDLQVPFKENLEIIQKSLANAGNKKVTIKSYPKINHLFQTSETGNPVEYQTIEETISPTVLKDVSDWILKQTK